MAQGHGKKNAAKGTWQEGQGKNMKNNELKNRRGDILASDSNLTRLLGRACFVICAALCLNSVMTSLALAQAPGAPSSNQSPAQINDPASSSQTASPPSPATQPKPAKSEDEKTHSSMSAAASQKADFEFAAPPSKKANILYRVHKYTGAVTACIYKPAILESGEAWRVGETHCYESGEGAKAGVQAKYSLKPSNYATETGVFRVNTMSGAISVCFVRFDRNQVVCSPFK